MAVIFKELKFSTSKDFDVVDITQDVQNAISESGLANGIANLFVIGSTASISTVEYEPNLVKDLKAAMERIAPSGIEYNHHLTWGDANGKSHVRATILGPGTTVPFKDGRLITGTWQQLVLLDFDVPARTRRIQLTLSGE
ncbi:secondary thiamine-phosphate synthase enzyme YjbQ [bacterium]|nr:secondary thiamine-phosphate synthase enzyme YjbQ [bacterium]MBU1025386.1 secondary thiamine-phosphate synthase enzyme YjbQ [bacterium]